MLQSIVVDAPLCLQPWSLEWFTPNVMHLPKQVSDGPPSASSAFLQIYFAESQISFIFLHHLILFAVSS